MDIINESENSIRTEVQRLVDTNSYLKGQTVNSDDLIETTRYVLFFSVIAADHIKERHSDPQKPGSLFYQTVSLRDVAQHLLNQQPTEQTDELVKWLGIETNQIIGEMGIAHADPAIVALMADYQMPDGDRETVKIKIGERKPTSDISMITSRLGKLDDGRTVLSLITLFPGGQTVDGKTVPMNRGDFAEQGFYFIVDGGAQ